jgi:hypothetical protein
VVARAEAGWVRRIPLENRIPSIPAQPPALDRKLPVPEDWSVLVERAQQAPAPPPMPFLDLQQMQQQR